MAQRDKQKQKSFFESKFGSDVEFRQRVFYMTCMCGLAATFLSAIMTLFTAIPMVSKLASWGCFAAMLIIAVVGMTTKKIKVFAVIMCGFIGIILIPLTFFLSGGMYSGMPIYFVLSIFGTAMLTDGMPRKVLLFASLIVDVLCFMAGWNYPNLVINFTATGAVGDIMSSVIIVGIVIYAISVTTLDEYTKYYDKTTELNIKLEKSATTDPLTGLYNRGYLINYLTDLVENDTDFHLALFDIDDFKGVNDEYGHIVGDAVLVNFARIMEKESASGIAARYGGEEFMMVIPGITDEEMHDRAERVREKSEESLKRHCNRMVTVSGGLYKYFKGETVDNLIEYADRNMYEAKRRGKNRLYEVMSRVGEGGMI